MRDRILHVTDPLNALDEDVPGEGGTSLQEPKTVTENYTASILDNL